MARPPGWTALRKRIVSCRDCDRLVAWREEVARTRVRRFADQSYWGRPVPGFGDPSARIVIVGLAPAAHGANRTGRAFTGDRSGDFLFAALHRAGLASQPTSIGRDDGLTLRDVFITLALRCAPPGNHPEPGELRNCARFLDGELGLLRAARVLVVLGAIAWNATLDHLVRRGISIANANANAPGPKPRFRHGAELVAPPLHVVASFHVSQQNTQTGRLDAAMFDAIVKRARALADASVATTRTR